jgi:hypothetical protein
MAMQEDLRQFFNTAEFADVADFAGVGAITVIFDEAYVRSSGAMGMENTVPSLIIPTAQMPANVIGKAVAIKAVNYLVAEKELYAPGLMALILEKA